MAPAGHTAETEVTGHHGTEPDPQWTTPTSAVSGERTLPMTETAVTAPSPLACTDDASARQMADDAPAPAESASGGGDCTSGEQQGTVLPFGHDQSLICMTPGCHRRRRVYCDNAYSSPHHLGSTCCVGCGDATLRIGARSDHSPTCCAVGPQPLQGIHRNLAYPVPSLAIQRLIAPPRPIQSALLPRLVQNDAVGEAFFSDQVGSDNFVDDGDDDESTGLERHET